MCLNNPMCAMDNDGGCLQLSDLPIRTPTTATIHSAAPISVVNVSTATGAAVKEDTPVSINYNDDGDSNAESRKDGDGSSSKAWNFCPQLRHHEVIEELTSILKVALPVALTTMMLHSKNIISMLFLGRMGKVELAGGSLAIGFANVTGFSVLKGLGMGMDPICSLAFGAKRFSVITQTYIKTVILLLLTSIPVIFVWIYVEPILTKLGQEKAILKVTRSYLLYSIPDLIAQAHATPIRSFLRTQGINSAASVVAMISAVIHLPLTYLLVTHFNMKVEGIALANSVYNLNINLGLLGYLYFSKTAIKPWVGSSFATTIVHGWKPLLSLAFPSLFSVCLEWWWYEIILFMSGLLINPEACVAAMGILIQTTGIIYVFPYSLGLSITQRVGHGLGSGQHMQARFTAFLGVGMGMAYGTLAFGLSLVVRTTWGKFYTDDPQVLMMVAGVLPILGLAEVGNSSQTAACGALTGSARPKVGVRINLAAFYLVGLPCSAVFAFKLGIGFEGLWLGLIAAQAACLSMLVYTLMQTDWKHQAKRAEELTMLTAGDKETGENLIA